MSSGVVDLDEERHDDVVDVPLETTASVDAATVVDKTKVTIEASSTMVLRTLTQFAIMVVFAVVYMLLFAGPGIGFGHEVPHRLPLTDAF